MAKRNRSNKIINFLVSILVICFILIGFGFYRFFYAGSGTNKYGDRLKGIEDHKLSLVEEDIKEYYKETETINNIKVNVVGKIIYINIEFKEGIGLTEAQGIAIKSLEAIEEDNLNFYDVQYLITQEEKEKESDSEESTEEVYNGFPCFGSKNANSNVVIWSTK